MKAIYLFVSILSISCCESWSPAGNHIKTKWAAEVNPTHVWPEYPRPQLERKNWVNLNGLWEYSITPIAANQPNKYDGQILVPFPVESSLSGVQKSVDQLQTLWYRRHFTSDVGLNELLILNLDAVDYHSMVYVNGHQVGEHKGGYNRFSFDITKYLNGNEENTLVVKVIDGTDASGPQPIGKQRLNPKGIHYTATTGIWQTVWLEKVPKTYITGLRIIPNIDTNSVEITVNTNGPLNHSQIQIVDTAGKVVASNEKASVNTPNKLIIPSPRLWSNTDPYLYNIHVKADADSVTSYLGMRKIEIKKDSKGINRFFLNDKPIFMFGPLDQGFWPDGIYTPPNEEAIIYDLKITKELGFNTIRKHIKVESDRWYYATDKMGFLVWQDFPAIANRKSAADNKQLELEMEQMVSQLHNFPSIVMWVTFNEGGGQYDTQRIVNLYKKWDPSRLVNEASGGNDFHASNIEDHHKYPGPCDLKLNPNRVVVCGEFGGANIVYKQHVWDPLHPNGIFPKSFPDDNPQHLQKFYLDKFATVVKNAKLGLGAAIYTQLTDVEGEVNGYLTYERAVIKLLNMTEIRREVEKAYQIN